MARKKKSRAKEPSRQAKRAAVKIAEAPPSIESRAAEAFTVAWMLSTMAALGAEVVSLLLRGGAAIGWFPLAVMVPADIMLFVALVTGITALILLPVAYRLRIEKPPMMIVGASLVIGLIPIAVVIMEWIVPRGAVM